MTEGADLSEGAAAAPATDASPAVDAAEDGADGSDAGSATYLEVPPAPVLLRVAAACGAIAVAVAVVPALATVLAWPLLCGLPAWFLVARVAPQIGPAGRLGVAVAAGIEGATHLTFLVARALGFDEAALTLVVALLAAATWALATLEIPGLRPPPPLPTRSGAMAALRAHRGAFTLAAASTAAVGLILELSAWHRTDDGWVSGGWNWSDFLVHVGIANSIRHGNFPPQVPTFAGEPLTYHWFGDFHSAILSAVAGVDVIGVLILSNALLAGALALLVYELTRTLTGSRRAALLAVPLTIAGGGMGFIRLGIDLHSGGSLNTLVSTTSYDNNFLSGWPYFRIASIMGTALLDQRPTAYGLVIVCAVVLLVHVSWGRSGAGVLVAGVMASLLAPFHFFAFPALYLVLVIQLLARRAWRDAAVWGHGARLFVPVVYAAGFMAQPVLTQHDKGVVHLTAGWPDAPTADGWLAVAFFYLTNLGVPFVLALAACLWRRTPARWLLAGWLVALFIVPNVVVVSTTTFDANKFFQFMWIPVAVLAAWFIRDWPRPVVAGVLALSMASPVLVAVWHVRDHAVALSIPQEAAGRWIEGNTPDNAVFITDAFIDSPVDLAGRLRITTFGPQVANIGYDPAPREADVHSVYCDGDAAAADIMRRYGAAYVLSTGGLLDCGGHAPTDFDHSAVFETVYSAGGVEVWRLRG